jgi:TRAP transporter TAXI family solute receptor
MAGRQEHQFGARDPRAGRVDVCHPPSKNKRPNRALTSREDTAMHLRALILASALAMASTANAQETYRMGGGPSGGAWHPAWSAATQQLTKVLGSKYNFQYSPSQGSVENVRRVRLGELASGWAHIPQIYEAWTGTGQFAKDGANQDFRVIANVQEQTQIVAVLADSPIKSYQDMKGKVVNLLAKGSGSSVNCVNMFTALGLIDQIDARYLGFAAAGRALADRQIDVYCSAGVPYTIPAVTEISLRKPVRYISLTPDEQKKIASSFKFYSPVTIPPQAEVKGVDAPTLSIGYDVWWIVSKQVSDQAVYDMLKAIADPDKLKELTSTVATWKSLSGKFDSLQHHKILVHPGAAKYWNERGAKVPGEIVKGYDKSS